MSLTLKPYRVFYGWWIVAGSFLISLLVGGVVFYGFTAFFEPIVQEMGWSYAQVSLASSLRGLETGLLAPLIGILVDRFGPRKLIFAGAITATAGLLILSRSTSLAMFYGAFGLLTLGTSACTGITLMTTVANWFHRKIGLASAISICGFGFSGLMIPLIVGLIDSLGWRSSLFVLAGAIIVIVLPLSIVFRHRPEQYGYLTDGDKECASPRTEPDAVRRETRGEDLKTAQALKSGAFWRLVLISMCHMVVVSSVILHVMPYLSSIGVARSIAGFIAAAVPITSIAGRLILGWLGDRFDRRKITAVAFVMMGIGILCFGLAATSGVWLVIPFLILFGTGYGGNDALRYALSREYFGRANFGSITGMIVGIGAVGGIVAPPLAGWAYDKLGSYQDAWFAFGALPLATLLAVLTLPRKVR